MKKAICGFLTFLTFVTVCFAQQDNANNEKKELGNLILKSGTELKARGREALDVTTTKSGDDFVFLLTEDVTGEGGLLIPKDSELLGRVVRVKSVNSDDPLSEISLSFDFLKFQEDFFKFKADILSVTGEGAKENIGEPDCEASPVFKGATVVSIKGKNLRLEAGSIYRLKLNLNVVRP